MTDDFDGAKLALIHRGDVITILRDDDPGIPFPAMWDLAGGGREGQERPAETALRETHEELGLELSEDRLHWSFREDQATGSVVWFFAAEVTSPEVNAIRFGNEGQCWQLMPVADFLAHPMAIPSLQRRLRLYLEWRSQNR